MGVASVMRGDKGGQAMLAVLLVVAVVVPILNLVVPESSPWQDRKSVV